MNFVQSEPGQDPVVVEGYFGFAPERVFQAWTQPDLIRQWFGIAPNSLEAAEVDLRPGGKWRFLRIQESDRWEGMEGEYLEIVENERLVFSWAHVKANNTGKREATPDSRVEISFTPRGSGTFVRLVHSAIGTEGARRGVGSGWENSFGQIQDALAKSAA